MFENNYIYGAAKDVEIEKLKRDHEIDRNMFKAECEKLKTKHAKSQKEHQTSIMREHTKLKLFITCYHMLRSLKRIH